MFSRKIHENLCGCLVKTFKRHTRLVDRNKQVSLSNFNLSCPILEKSEFYRKFVSCIVLSYYIAFFFNLVCFDRLIF